jgi:transcriptional regulator with XRE-family HTH domain
MGISIDEAVVNYYHKNTTITFMFSHLVKELRIAKRLTLRDFCAQMGLDPSNWSKVERGVNPPPGDIGVLERLAEFFGLSGDSKLDFLDKAAIQRKEIPKDLADEELFVRALPAFFRAARGHKLTQSELESFAADIRKLHEPDPVVVNPK